MLILGGAAVVNALTGVDLYAASMIIPVGVILYTAAGGLKATFMCAISPESGRGGTSLTTAVSTHLDMLCAWVTETCFICFHQRCMRLCLTMGLSPPFGVVQPTSNLRNCVQGVIHPYEHRVHRTRDLCLQDLCL